MEFFFLPYPAGTWRQDDFISKWTHSCADPEGMGQGVQTPPPRKITKYWVSYQYWSGSPVKPQSNQASIQCWATFGPPANVSLASRWWPAFCAILDPLSPHQLKTKNTNKQKQNKKIKVVGSPPPPGPPRSPPLLKKLSGSAPFETIVLNYMYVI